MIVSVIKFVHVHATIGFNKILSSESLLGFFFLEKWNERFLASSWILFMYSARGMRLSRKHTHLGWPSNSEFRPLIYCSFTSFKGVV